MATIDLKISSMILTALNITPRVPRESMLSYILRTALHYNSTHNIDVNFSIPERATSSTGLCCVCDMKPTMLNTITPASSDVQLFTTEMNRESLYVNTGKQR